MLRALFFTATAVEREEETTEDVRSRLLWMACVGEREEEEEEDEVCGLGGWVGWLVYLAGEGNDRPCGGDGLVLYGRGRGEGGVDHRGGEVHARRVRGAGGGGQVGVHLVWCVVWWLFRLGKRSLPLL